MKKIYQKIIFLMAIWYLFTQFHCALRAFLWQTKLEALTFNIFQHFKSIIIVYCMFMHAFYRTERKTFGGKLEVWIYALVTTTKPQKIFVSWNHTNQTYRFTILFKKGGFKILVKCLTTPIRRFKNYIIPSSRLCFCSKNYSDVNKNV